MKNTLLLLMLALGASSCFASFDANERLWLKSIKTPTGAINWFTYSSAFSDSPDFIIFESADAADTLCRSDNVKSMALKGTTLHVHFNRRPRLYMEPIFIPGSLHGYRVVLDTTPVPFSNKGRHYFTNQGEATGNARN